MTFELRPAEPTDAPALAHMHVTAWRETYRGIVPDKMLADLDVEARSKIWERILQEPEDPVGAVFLAIRSDRIVGFGGCGVQRSEELRAQGFDAEINAIYLLQSVQRRGLGRTLMAHMARDAMERGRRHVGLWVLRENVVARRFYEALGGVIIGEKVERWPAGEFTEIAYGWRGLASLAAAG